MKKKFNIIDAVKYLEKNPDAIIKSEIEKNCFLVLDGYFDSCHQKVMIKKQDSSLDPLWVIDFEHNWILEESEKKQRTHKEIISNWFKTGHDWMKIECYGEDDKCYYFDGSRYKKEYFNNLEMKTDEEIKEMEE